MFCRMPQLGKNTPILPSELSLSWPGFQLNQFYHRHVYHTAFFQQKIISFLVQKNNSWKPFNCGILLSGLEIKIATNALVPLRHQVLHEQTPPNKMQKCCFSCVKVIPLCILGMAERWTAVVSMVIGYLMCFALITCLISTVGTMSVSGNEYKKKVLFRDFFWV